MAINDMGVSAVSLVVNDPDGDGFIKGRAYLLGPEAGQAQKGASGLAAGVCRHGAKHGQPATIQTEGFAEVESGGAVAYGADVFVAADGRGSASGTAKLGNATSAVDGEGERLTVDLSTKNGYVAAPA